MRQDCMQCRGTGVSNYSDARGRCKACSGERTVRSPEPAMNKGHIIKRPSPMFKNESIYQGVLKRPDGSIANASDWGDECEAISFLTDRGIKQTTITTTEEGN